MNKKLESNNEEYDIQAYTQDSIEPFVNHNDSFMFRMNNSQRSQMEEILQPIQHMDNVKFEQTPSHFPADESLSISMTNKFSTTFDKKGSSTNINESSSPIIINTSFYKVASKHEVKNTGNASNPMFTIPSFDRIKNASDGSENTPSQNRENINRKPHEPYLDLKKAEENESQMSEDLQKPKGLFF